MDASKEVETAQSSDIDEAPARTLDDEIAMVEKNSPKLAELFRKVAKFHDK